MPTIVDLGAQGERSIKQTAELLIASFGDSWPTMEAAVEEIRESLGVERISRVLLDGNGDVTGWIGGIRQYDGNVWELHPLVIRSDRQGQGLGRALVADFEERVRERGGITVWLGSDDENYQTSLGGVDLYPDVYHHVAAIKNLARHPYEFYQKLGYVIVGVLPDANGVGKPDIYMAKRVGGS